MSAVWPAHKVWLHVDSCASSHILDPALCMIDGCSGIFDLQQLAHPESIKVGGGYTYATHTGSMRVMVCTSNKDRGALLITDALIVEGFGSLLLSLVRLENDHDAHVIRNGHKRTLRIGNAAFLMSTRCNIYSIAARIMKPSAQHASIASADNNHGTNTALLLHSATDQQRAAKDSSSRSSTAAGTAHSSTAASTAHSSTAAGTAHSKTAKATAHDSITAADDSMAAMVARAPPLNADVWHARMGHANMRQVERAAAIEGNGVDINCKLYTGQCHVCPMGKSHQQPHPVPPVPSRADIPAAMMYMDVFGPLPEPSIGGARFAVGIVDSYSRMVFLFTTPNHTAEAILDVWQGFITRQVIPLGRHVQRLRTDNAPEFSSADFMNYNHNAGIVQEFSSPYTPQQLGMIESVWKPLTAFMRMSLHEARLPAGLWAEMLHTKVHIRNRLPYMTNPEQMSPYRMWFGKEPNLSYLRVIGSAAFVHEERGGSKLLPRAWQGKLVGYNHDGHMHDSNSYRVYNPIDNKVYVSRNVTIIEPLITARSEVTHHERTSSTGDDVNNGTNSGGSTTGESDSEGDSSDDDTVCTEDNDESVDVHTSDVHESRTSMKTDNTSHTESSRDASIHTQHSTTVEGFNPYTPSTTIPTLPTSASSPTQSVDSNRSSTVPATGLTHSNESGITTATSTDSQQLAQQQSEHAESLSDDPTQHTAAQQRPAAAKQRKKGAAKAKQGGVVSNYKLRSGTTGSTVHTSLNASTLTEQWVHKHLILPAYTTSLADTAYAFTATEVIAAPRDALLPRTHEEAMSTNERDSWLAAEQAEISSLQAFNVFTWVTPPENARIHKSKWVYAHKRNSIGDIIRCKARFVACGYSQIKGQDYDDAFAPVARMSTYRACIAYAAYNDYEIRQLDVKTAFLQADLLETTYVYPPVGYHKTDARGQQMVWRLNRSLYGLVQAARCWYLSISTHLTSHGFKQSDADPCLFTDCNNTIIVLYVDDMLVIGSTRAHIQSAVEVLKQSYDIKDIGELEYCLGIAVKRDRKLHTVSLSQQQYVEDLLKSFSMSDCNAALTPATQTPAQTTDTLLDDTQSRRYRELVGSLMYLATATRPDITYAVTQLSKHMMTPTHTHWTAAKHVLRYLKGNVRTLTYSNTSSTLDLVGYVDADWAGDVHTRKSTTGYVFTLGGTAIAWKTKLQPIVATSSTYAEYIALTTAAQEAVALRRLLITFKLPTDQPTILHEDNAAALAISEHHGADHDRSKHMDVRYHYIRELKITQQIRVVKIETAHNVADMFTKALERVKHSAFSQAIMG